MKKTKIILPLFLFTLFSSVGFAEEIFRSYRQGRADFTLSVDYFKTTANFGADGSKIDLLSGTYFQKIDTPISARYVLFDDWALFTTVKVSSSESADRLATRRNSSVSQIFIGSDHQIFNTGFWAATVDLSYAHAIEKVDPAVDSALNNDGVDEVRALVTTNLNFDGLIPFGQIGVNYRTQGLSTLLLYTSGLELRLSHVTLGGLIRGFATLKEDENTERPFVRDIVTGRVNAGSRKYYSVNPTLLDSELYLTYHFAKDLSFKTFGGFTLSGSNTAVGFQVGAAINWGFGAGNGRHGSLPFKSNSVRKPSPKNTLTIDPTDKSFKEDTNDGVNQDYFKPLAPSKDQYIEQLEGSPKSLKNATEIEADTQFVDPDQKKPEPYAKEYKIKLRKKKKKK